VRVNSDLQETGHQGKARSGTDLPKQAVESGGIGPQFRRERRQPDGDQRREQHAAPDRLQAAARDNPDGAGVGRND
jgi:hypothetical protein